MSVEKRPAFEPPSELIAPVVPPPEMRRPTATAFGALLVVCRVVAGVVWLTVLAVQWNDIVRDELHIEIEDASESEAAGVVLAVILAFGAVILLIDLMLAVLVYRGNNAARLAVMIFATFSIIAAAIDYFGEGTEITIRTTLVTLALDILVLLALSSRAARAYAQRPRPRRKGARYVAQSRSRCGR
jgi:hypothetical protein